MDNLIPFPELPSPITSLRPDVSIRYGVIWEAEVRTREFQQLTPCARLLFYTLAHLVDGDQQRCTIGLSALGRAAGILRGNVARYARELEAAGFLEVRRAGLRRNVYQLLMPLGLAAEPQLCLPLKVRRMSWSDRLCLVEARRR